MAIKNQPANRRARKRNVKSLPTLTSVRTRGSIDPPNTKTDISLTQRFQMHAIAGGSLAPVGTAFVSYQDIVNRIPGGAAVWDRMRIQHVEVWGPDVNPTSTALGSSPGIQVTMSTNSLTNFNTDVPTFTDHGTAGQSRPHVSFVPDLFTRMQWNSSSSPDAFLIIQSEDITFKGTFLVHITCEVRSVPPTGIQFQRNFNTPLTIEPHSQTDPSDSV